MSPKVPSDGKLATGPERADEALVLGTTTYVAGASSQLVFDGRQERPGAGKQGPQLGSVRADPFGNGE